MPRIEGDDLDLDQPLEPERAPASELEYEPNEPLAEAQPTGEPELRAARRAQPPRAKPRPTLRDEDGAVAGSADGDDRGSRGGEWTDTPEKAKAAAAASAAPTEVVPNPTSHARSATPPPATSHARNTAPLPAATSHARTPDPAPTVQEDEEASANAYAANGEHRGRRNSKRRGLGLVVTGGCAGIAVVGFLVFGSSGGTNTAGTANSGVVSSSSGRTTPAPVISVSVAPATSVTNVDFSASSTASATASSASPSASPTATHTESTAPTSTPSTGNSTTASAAPTQTRTVKPTPTPSASSTCWWIFC
jgi:hypothetical protein